VLKPQVLLRSDCAFKAGELGRDMYFIQKGFIQITGDAKVGQGDLVFCTLLAGSAIEPRRAARRGSARHAAPQPPRPERRRSRGCLQQVPNTAS
jgi:hypothetical protein